MTGHEGPAAQMELEINILRGWWWWVGVGLGGSEIFSNFSDPVIFIGEKPKSEMSYKFLTLLTCHQRIFLLF